MPLQVINLYLFGTYIWIFYYDLKMLNDNENVGIHLVYGKYSERHCSSWTAVRVYAE